MGPVKRTSKGPRFEYFGWEVNWLAIFKMESLQREQQKPKNSLCELDWSLYCLRALLDESLPSEQSKWPFTLNLQTVCAHIAPSLGIRDNTW